MLRQVATRGLLGRLVGAECAGYAGVAGTNSAFLSTSPRMQEGDVVMDAFKKQQVQYKELMKGLSKMDVPLSGDAAAVKAYAAEVEKLKKRVGMPDYEAVVKAEMAYAMSVAGNDVRKFVSSVLGELDVSKTAYEGITQDVMEAIAEAERVSGGELGAGNAKGWQALGGKVKEIEKKYGLEGGKVKEAAVLDMYVEHVEGIREAVEGEVRKMQEAEGVDVKGGLDLKGLKPQVA